MGKREKNKRVFGCLNAKRHGILNGTKVFQVRDEKAAMQLSNQAAKRVDRCMDAKKHRGVVCFVEECFGANHTFSPMVGEGGTECRMREEFFNVHNNSSARKNTPLTHFCKFASLINKNFPLPHSCSFAVNGSPVGVCNDFVILPPSSRPQLTRAGEREPSRHCEGGNGLPTEAIQLINNIFGKITPHPLFKKNLSPLTSHFSREGKRYAFTLAEVLITLGIIGVVAALTIPAIIQKQRNSAVETRLKKVYSVMNQAVLMAESVYGAKEDWDFSDAEFVDKYFAPFLNKVEIKTINGTQYDYAAIYFSDGSLLLTKKSQKFDGSVDWNYGMSQDYYFYPNAKNYDYETLNDRSCTGKTCFTFRFAPTGSGYHKGRGFEPYLILFENNMIDIDVLYNHELYGCNKEVATPNYCTALVWHNGWKIPDNYPFKVK